MSVVISKGKAIPIGAGKAWPLSGMEQSQMVRSSRSLELLGLDVSADYAAIYASQPWIFALANKITRNIARLPLVPMREDPETYHRERLPRAHDLAALISRPFPRGSTFRLVESIVGSLMVYGHALCWKYRPRPGAPPVELWPLDWSRVSVQAGESQPIDMYVYRASRGTKPMLPDDVVHFTWWSPMGIRGTSPLEPLRTTLLLDDAGRRYAVASFANGIRPSGALVSEKKIGDDAKKEIKAQLDTVHATPDNAFRMMLLDGGLSWQPFSHTSQEAQTIEHRKLNAIEACAVYDMPPPMVQILDQATFSNIDEQHRMLYQDTLGPIATNLEQTLQAQLIWGEPGLATAADETDGGIENTVLSFDFDEVLRSDIVKRAASYAAMRAAGGLTVNDIRVAEGKPKINHPAADAVLIPLNMAAVGSEGIQEFPTERISDPAASIPEVAAALRDHVDGKIDGLVLDLRTMEQSLRSMGSPGTEMAASIASLAQTLVERDPVQVILPEGLVRFEEGSIKSDVKVEPTPVELHHHERGGKTRVVDFGDGRTAKITEED